MNAGELLAGWSSGDSTHPEYIYEAMRAGASGFVLKDDPPELLFRGLLLPRTQRAFGRVDWVVNGVLFAAYHLHMPWVIPTALLDTLSLAYPSRRYRSALIGILVHSSQNVMIIAMTLALALR